MSSEPGADPASVTYEQLAELELDFDDVDTQIVRQQYLASKQLYARREEIVSKISYFWSLVLEAAPPELDRFIQPTDSEIFATALRRLSVRRHELDKDPIGGEPRSLEICMEFCENEWFEDGILSKKLWWRRAHDGWTGLVSEPVPIKWRAGKDLTKGLTQGAWDLWQARQHSCDMAKRDLPEYDRMEKLTEAWTGENTSFFTWFAWISGRRWVGETESAAALRTEADRRAAFRADPRSGGSPSSPEEHQAELQVEAHEDGDTIATVVAEDLWPGAIRYFSEWLGSELDQKYVLIRIATAQQDLSGSDEGFESSSEGSSDESATRDSPEGARVNLRKLVEISGEAGASGSQSSGQKESARKRRRKE